MLPAPILDFVAAAVCGGHLFAFSPAVRQAMYFFLGDRGFDRDISACNESRA